MHALQLGDTLSSNHRGHGHAIAKGVSLDRFFAEILGRRDGYCAGRGGSMHVADADKGMLGANGIVGAGMSIAVGSALAHQVQRNGAISVVFFGDGALGEGLIHESFNLAAMWRLPCLFICENNGWSEFTPTEKEFSTTLDRIADAFRIPYQSVDGNDAAAVYESAVVLAEVARKDGPAVLEAHTRRIRGHFEGDQQRYRDPADLAAAKDHDAFDIVGRRLHDLGVKQAELDIIAADITGEIDRAVEFAFASAEPIWDDAIGNVYATGGAYR